nr:hypothetical protein [Tanacetum cinerariifolium]
MIKQKKENNYKMMNLPILSMLQHKKLLSLPPTTLYGGIFDLIGPAGDELEQESAKKQKVDDDQEAAELNRCLEIVPDDKDDVTIDATPLSSKSPTIVDYKIYKEGRKSDF